MDFIKTMLMLVFCYLVLIELGIDRVRHQLRHDTEYKPPVFPIAMICFYIAVAILFIIQSLK